MDWAGFEAESSRSVSEHLHPAEFKYWNQKFYPQDKRELFSCCSKVTGFTRDLSQGQRVLQPCTACQIAMFQKK
jgi:hypothetical protein